MRLPAIERYPSRRWVIDGQNCHSLNWGRYGLERRCRHRSIDLSAHRTGRSFVAYFAFKKSNESFRLSLSADLVTKLDDKFNGPDLKSIRKTAARALLSNTNLGEAEDVLDFFETVGLLMRLEALNPEMVHNTFFHWANLYWIATKDYIIARRKSTSISLWVYFKSLHTEVCRIEKLKDRTSKDLQLDRDSLRQYLQEEVEL